VALEGRLKAPGEVRGRGRQRRLRRGRRCGRERAQVREQEQVRLLLDAEATYRGRQGALVDAAGDCGLERLPQRRDELLLQVGEPDGLVVGRARGSQDGL
jgi:hypothetical protein